MRDFKEIIKNKKTGDFQLAEFFHNNTELSQLNIKEHASQIENYFANNSESEKKLISYPYSNKMKLRKKSYFFSFYNRLLFKRRSRRDFFDKKVSFQEISDFLSMSYGNTSIQNEIVSTVPSAGGIFPLHIYLISLHSELKNGIYHYYYKNDYLNVLSQDKGINYKKINKFIITRNLTGVPGVLCVITADLRSVCSKYGDRGYRFVLLEAGHLAQNMLLNLEMQKLKGVSLGGYYDRELAEFLQIDYSYNKPIYVISFGK